MWERELHAFLPSSSNSHMQLLILCLPTLSLRSFPNASSMENNTMNSTETMPAFKRKLEIITRRSSTSKRRQIEFEIEIKEEEVHDEKLEESISSSTSSDSCDDEEEEEEKEEVEKKIVALQRMVPGGEMLGVDKLFEETAGYILALQSQIKALRVLATFIQDFDKENRKFGG